MQRAMDVTHADWRLSPFDGAHLCVLAIYWAHQSVYGLQMHRVFFKFLASDGRGTLFVKCVYVITETDIRKAPVSFCQIKTVNCLALKIYWISSSSCLKRH